MGKKLWGLLFIALVCFSAHGGDEAPIINDDQAPIINDDEAPIINDDRLATEIKRSLNAIGPVAIVWQASGQFHFRLEAEDVGAIRKAIQPWNKNDQHDFLERLEFVLKERWLLLLEMENMDPREYHDEAVLNLQLLMRLMGQLRNTSETYCPLQFGDL